MPKTRRPCWSGRLSRRPGVALARAAQRKRRHTYPELLRARRCRLVVFGIETGGRWSEEAATFLRLLAQARAASAPVAVRRAAQAAWVYRWSGILSVAAQRAFAASLLELPAATELGAAGDPPALHELLRGEGLTRIALRKYTSFGDHLAVKHFGARPGIHPNINRFSVTLRLRLSEPGLAYIQTSTVSASACG